MLLGLLEIMEIPGQSNTFFRGIKSAFRFSGNPGSSLQASITLSQLRTLSADQGGLRLASVHCLSASRATRPPVRHKQLCWGEASAERTSGSSHGGRPPVQHAHMETFLQIWLEEVVHLEEAGLLVRAVAGGRGHLEGLPG